MKSLNRVMALIAAISVTIFIISLVVLATSDGNHDTAGKICISSLLVGFLALVIYHPDSSGDSA